MRPSLIFGKKKSSRELYLKCVKKKLNCPYCLGTNLSRKGFSRNGKQRYKCQECKKRIVLHGRQYFVSSEQVAIIGRLLLERISLRGICRAMQVSFSWLRLHIQSVYRTTPEDLNYRPLAGERVSLETNGKPVIYLKMMALECDEMWSFVQKKENKAWIWIALCRESRQVMAVFIGDRSTESAKKLIEMIPGKEDDRYLYFTDDWDPYQAAIPEGRRIVTIKKKYTNAVERINCTIRQRVSRLVRKALSFSKSWDNHVKAIRYFIAHYNLEKQALLRKEGRI